MYSLPQSEFETRRRAMMDAMGEDSVAIFVATPERIRSNDSGYIYRPSSDILYLSGFREPETVIVLAPGHKDGEFAMFVPARDPLYEQWEGRRAGPEGARENYGADAAYTVGQLDEILPKYLDGRKTLYYTLGKDSEFDVRVTGWMNKLRHRRAAAPGAPGNLVDARDIVHEMRLFKSEAELELMRRAAEISAEAHMLAMAASRPGMMEYELQALIEYHFRKNGGDYPAYTSIVGGGDNATILHYVENRDRLEDGQVVLIDAGCEWNFYAGDISRSFPVNGKFTAAQRDVYQVILDAQKAAIEDIRPGLAYNQIQDNTVRRLTEGLVQLGILSGSVDELIESNAFKKYYPHGTGHWLGIDVHDVGSYFGPDGKHRELQPGMVLTIEPGLYIPHDDENAPAEMRGLGIRIEDNIVVTASGYENMTLSCIKEISDLESHIGTAD